MKSAEGLVCYAMSDGALLTRLKSSHKGVPAEQLAAVLRDAAATLEARDGQLSALQVKLHPHCSPPAPHLIHQHTASRLA